MPRPRKSSPSREMPDEEPKSKNYGERVPFRKFFKVPDPMGEAEWVKVEEVSGLKLGEENRDRIHLFMKLYSGVGPLYSDTQSVLAKTADKEIKSWRAATNTLWRALSPTDPIVAGGD